MRQPAKWRSLFFFIDASLGWKSGLQSQGLIIQSKLKNDIKRIAHVYSGNLLDYFVLSLSFAISANKNDANTLGNRSLPDVYILVEVLVYWLFFMSFSENYILQTYKFLYKGKLQVKATAFFTV